MNHGPVLSFPTQAISHKIYCTVHPRTPIPEFPAQKSASFILSMIFQFSHFFPPKSIQIHFPSFFSRPLILPLALYLLFALIETINFYLPSLIYLLLLFLFSSQVSEYKREKYFISMQFSYNSCKHQAMSKSIEKIYIFFSVHLNKKMRRRWRHVLSTEIFLFLFYTFFLPLFSFVCLLYG